MAVPIVQQDGHDGGLAAAGDVFYGAVDKFFREVHGVRETTQSPVVVPLNALLQDRFLFLVNILIPRLTLLGGILVFCDQIGSGGEMGEFRGKVGDLADLTVERREINVVIDVVVHADHVPGDSLNG